MKSTQHKKTNKHSFGKDQANRKTSLLFMQFGLVFALLVTFFAMESKTLVNNDNLGDLPTTIYDPIDDPIPDTTPKEPKQEEPKSETIPDPEPDMTKLDIKSDDDDIDETDFLFSSEDDQNKKTDLTDYSNFDEVKIQDEIIEDVKFIDIKDAPIFPGCKGSPEEKKQCFSDQVKKLVARKFNADLAQELGLSTGKKRISVQFTVDKSGTVTDVLVRAPHKRLEKEARRVVNLLPEMTPGKQRGRKVGVKFQLPIVFIVE